MMSVNGVGFGASRLWLGSAGNRVAAVTSCAARDVKRIATVLCVNMRVCGVYSSGR